MADIQIINHALQLVNQPPIQTLADLTNSNRIIQTIYDESLSYLLSIESFSFSISLSTLATISGAVLFPKYVVAKAFPSGALNIVRVLDEYGDIPHYKIVGDQIQFLRDGTYVCEYTTKVDESKLPSHFRTAFAYYLAYQISGNLHEALNMRQNLELEFNKFFRRAIQTDAVNARMSVPNINQNLYSEPYDNPYIGGQEVDRYGYATPYYG